jgi:hypothetical protein
MSRTVVAVTDEDGVAGGFAVLAADGWCPTSSSTVDGGRMTR